LKPVKQKINHTVQNIYCYNVSLFTITEKNERK